MYYIMYNLHYVLHTQRMYVSPECTPTDCPMDSIGTFETVVGDFCTKPGLWLEAGGLAGRPAEGHRPYRALPLRGWLAGHVAWLTGLLLRNRIF